MWTRSSGQKKSAWPWSIGRRSAQMHVVASKESVGTAVVARQRSATAGIPGAEDGRIIEVTDGEIKRRRQDERRLIEMGATTGIGLCRNGRRMDAARWSEQYETKTKGKYKYPNYP
uniref:Uncharacterized protein n=1 Tax=Oryza meridionalis TaxID=40149 RepID=A0A0E0FAV4_9ORYZ